MHSQQRTDPARRLSPAQRRLVLAAIFLLAAFLRLGGLRWDAACVEVSDGSGQVCAETHLHPDERFLTMVATSADLPASVSEYFDSARSPLNPHNRGHSFFAYGLFPVTTTKVVARAIGLDGYDQIHLVGRVIAAFCGLATLLLLFVIARRLYDETVAMWAALLLALAVQPIQQAHFFTVDTMLTTAVWAALLFATDIERRGAWRDYALFGVALGAAVAIKVSVATLAIVGAVAALASRHRHASGVTAQRPGRVVGGLCVAALASLAVFRVLQPYAFSGPGLLGLELNPQWLANMREIGELVSGRRDFPPNHQWAGRTPLWFPWTSMVTVGMGPALGLAAWLGWVWAGVRLARRRGRHHLLPWLWVAILFAHLGTRFTPILRYMLPIYPALALFAAWLLVAVWRRARRSGSTAAKVLAGALVGTVAAGTLAWAWAFTAIYRRPHSRVEASRWIYAHVPPGSSIAHETWDDALPLPLDGRAGMGEYVGLPLHPYAEDSPRKLEELIESLDRADYL
ncbi:MAG: glycosyltransferase family 39 protein, partial [Thermoanaerobaculia bacterium]|nr:glycosyltransferase family 39 protein [Thermoanaerobaculia bacterium]